MRKERIIIYMTLLLALTTGCRSHRHIANNDNRQPDNRPTPGETAKPQLDTIRNATYVRYCANFSCTVEGIAINGQIRIVHDSCIWISVNKIIEVGRIMLTPTRVSGYSRIMGKYFDGTYSEVRQRWGVDIDYGTVEALLVGNCPPACTRGKEPERHGDGVTLWYNQKGGVQRKVTLQKEYATMLLTSTLIAQDTPQAQVRCAYSDRTTVEGQLLPTTIDAGITLRGSTRQTRLSLSRISLNQKQNTPFSIPQKLDRL